MTREQAENRVAWSMAYQFARLAGMLTDYGPVDSCGRFCAVSMPIDHSGICGIIHRHVGLRSVDGTRGRIIAAHDYGTKNECQRRIDALAEEALKWLEEHDD